MHQAGNGKDMCTLAPKLDEEGRTVNGEGGQKSMPIQRHLLASPALWGVEALSMHDGCT